MEDTKSQPCPYTHLTTSRVSLDEMDRTRPTTWTEWYRFARETLGLAPVEAADYATARYVEQENRARLRDRWAGTPSPSP